jgi:ribonuclease D
MAATQPEVRYTYNVDQANALIARLTFAPGPLGFDIEWKPNFTKGRPDNPVALVQLSNADDAVLIQLSAMSRFPANLKEVLANPAIIKAGVGIEGDMRKLYQDCNVSHIRSCVDLALLARNVDNAQWKGRYRDPIGLARLALAYMNKELTKGKVTRSNWEKVPLTLPQIECTISVSMTDRAG